MPRLEENVYGPYISRRYNRKFVTIRQADGTWKTKHFSRYKMEKKLGRELLTEEEVDHKDDDITNDDIDNLQILTKAENMKKMHASYLSNPIFKFICPICKVQAEKMFSRDVKSSWDKGFNGPFCSGKCRTQFRWYVELPQTIEERQNLAEKFGFTLRDQVFITDGEVCYK